MLRQIIISHVITMWQCMGDINILLIKRVLYIFGRLFSSDKFTTNMNVIAFVCEEVTRFKFKAPLLVFRRNPQCTVHLLPFKQLFIQLESLTLQL